MSRKADLRKQRAGTVINVSSKKQESDLYIALDRVIARLQDDFDIRLYHESEWKLAGVLAGVVASLRESFPGIDFEYHFEKSSMRPDGGILSILDHEEIARPVLIAEVKNQGTNDLRAAEGKSKQAKGNAIERLGKNVIGFRTAMMAESIVPFLCFGYGCDFAEDSSILDRVTTIAMFGPLNEISVVNRGENGVFKWRIQSWELFLPRSGVVS